MLKAYCGKRWRIFWRVKLPSAMPPFFAGLEQAIVLAVLAAVVSELLGAVGGIGYRILTFNTNLDLAGQFAALLLLSVTGFVLHAIVRYAGDKVVFWGRAKEGSTN
jgi:NitT/TauT family transport system permease protein